MTRSNGKLSSVWTGPITLDFMAKAIEKLGILEGLIVIDLSYNNLTDKVKYICISFRFHYARTGAGLPLVLLITALDFPIAERASIAQGLGGFTFCEAVKAVTQPPHKHHGDYAAGHNQWTHP